MYTDPVRTGAGNRTDLLQSKWSRGTMKIAQSLPASALCLSIYSLALGPNHLQIKAGKSSHQFLDPEGKIQEITNPGMYFTVLLKCIWIAFSSSKKLKQDRNGYNAKWTSTPSTVLNLFFWSFIFSHLRFRLFYFLMQQVRCGNQNFQSSHHIGLSITSVVLQRFQLKWFKYYFFSGIL